MYSFYAWNAFQPGFTYSVRGMFTKHEDDIQKFKGIKDSRDIYQNE